MVMAMPQLELSPPHNWCDRACERCALASLCPCAPSPGQDAVDGWPDLVRQLQAALDLLEEQARQQGISLDDLPARDPPTVTGELLEQAATRLAHSLRAIDMCVPQGLLLAMKAARIAACLDDHGPVWQADGIPNLLLIERVLAQVTHEFQRRRPSLAREQRDRAGLHLEQLAAVLAPLYATIQPTDRTMIDILIDSGRAPSPFITTDKASVPKRFS